MREEASTDLGTTDWHHSWKTLAGSGVDTKGLLDHPIHIFEIPYLLIRGHIIRWKCLIQLLLEFLDYVGLGQTVIEQGAGCVRSGVGARDELGEGFGSEF